jgi:hypothetical protein
VRRLFLVVFLGANVSLAQTADLSNESVRLSLLVGFNLAR